MTSAPLERIRLWLRHSAERAESVSNMKVWLLAAAVGVLVSYGVILFTIAVEALTTWAYGEGTSLLAQGARGQWGVGLGQSRVAAEDVALAFCQNYGAGCEVRAWACSP